VDIWLDDGWMVVGWMDELWRIGMARDYIRTVLIHLGMYGTVCMVCYGMEYGVMMELWYEYIGTSHG
jgi:hypothetical protein